MQAHAKEMAGISVFRVKPLRNIVRPARAEQIAFASKPMRVEDDLPSFVNLTIF